jgi:preprotein translocase subunit YajC
MTNFGVFGTILSIDEEDNRVELESTPGTVLTVHRQTIARVIDTAEEPAVSPAGVEGEPEFGQRLDETPGDETPDVKKSDD